MNDMRDFEVELLRRLEPTVKLAVMNGLIRQAYTLKEARVRYTEPDLPKDAVRERVREAVAGGRS